LSANVVITSTGSKISSRESLPAIDLQEGQQTSQKAVSAGKYDSTARASLRLIEERVSRWSQSRLKRFFDIVCVLMAIPLLIPVFLVVGLAVRFTSKGPVLFLQKRTGLHRRNFTILKFRTMEHLENGARHKVTTAGNQQFTPVGSFLRRWKLDELPQVFNVLVGDMTLVGPRPKLPEHQLIELKCRPGITGAATIAFAREEQILACLPHDCLDAYYHSIILPAKLRLDREYMVQATFLTDLKLIMDTITRRWGSSEICELLDLRPLEMQRKTLKAKARSSFAIASGLADMGGDESMTSGD
jgi:lipopolysaccharide/colanic/teichoic acid biosynthesis glycosyltransferase